MSRGAKQVLGVAAAIAVPYAAPAIASAIGASAAFGATAGSALTGAGLGALSSRALGGNVAQGAVLGAIGGGIGGYMGGTPGVTDPNAPLTAAEMGTAGAAPAAFNPVTGDAYTAAGQTAGPMSYNPVTGDAYGATGAGLTPPPSAGGSPQTFTEALSRVPGEIAGRFRDPRVLADITLRAAGQLAGAAFAGNGLSGEEQALLDEQVAELRTLREQNAELFQQRVQQAQDLIGQSKYFDPEYFGLQSARRAQTAGAAAKRAGLRGLEGSRRQGEARRFDLATGRATGTAYDTGFTSAIAPRLQTQQAGLAAMPTGYPSSIGTYAPLANVYAARDTRQQERAQRIAGLFGTATGISNLRDRDSEYPENPIVF